MRENELISVVIPCYNRRDRLLESVRSVLSQSYVELELIVVDDGSTDGTYELFEAEHDPRLRFLRYEENRGACFARNYGAQRARGEYLAFQDSDDIWLPEKLEKQLEHIRHSGADMVFCGINRVAPSGSEYYFPVHAFHPEHALEELLAENRIGTQTMLMRRFVWEEVRFDDEFRRYQDWDFAICAAERFSIAYLPEALVNSAVYDDSISHSVKSYPALQRLYTKHEALYIAYPKSAAIMNLRMAKRLRYVKPFAAMRHFVKSRRLMHTMKRRGKRGLIA